MATLRKGFAILVLLLCLGVQVRAAEMWRNLEDLGGFDGYISSATPNSFTDNETLLVTYLDATRWSFLRFNVSSLPDASQVQSVKLWLWTENPGLNVNPAAMYMHPLYVPFSSSTTWNNKNISVYAGATNVPVGGWNSWTVIDITQYYQKWRSGQWVNHGIIFSPNLAQVRFFNWFASANYVTIAAKKPRIQVTYTGSATPVQFLSFPLPSTLYPQGAYTAGKVTSVVDHSMRINPSNGRYPYGTVANGGGDGVILSFTGERVNGAVSNSTCVQGNTYLQGLYSIGGCPSGYTSYDEHPGYDYRTTTGTVVRAAAGGVVVSNNGQRCVLIGISDCVSWGYVGVSHSNGFITQYGHLSRIDVVVGQVVNEGQQLGLSGAAGGVAPHFHFEVLKLKNGYQNNYNPDSYWIVDPYGWVGAGTDGLYSVSAGVAPTKLWK